MAQNRQDDRDRVQIEQDRSRNERNLADTEYLTREVAALRISLREVATRDFVRSELRSLLEELIALQDEDDDAKESRNGQRNPATTAIKTVSATKAHHTTPKASPA